MDGGVDGGGCWFKWMQSERHYRSPVVENVFTSPARGQRGGHIDASLSFLCLSAQPPQKNERKNSSKAMTSDIVAAYMSIDRSASPTTA